MATSAVLDGPSGLSYRGPSPILIGQVLAACVIAIGTTVLLGWVLGLEMLTGLRPGAHPMKANTAVGLILAGAALLLAPSTRRWAGPLRLALGGAVLALGLATLAEYAFDWRMGIDDLLTRNPAATGLPGLPGRPSPIAALNFVLAGLALLVLDSGGGWRVRPAELLALTIGLLTFISFQGYVFGEASLQHVPAFSTVGFHTAVAFVALSTALFVIRPSVGLMRSVTADGIGGATLRRLLPVSMLLPLAISWARLQGERGGYFDAFTGGALVATAMAACLMLLAFLSIAPLAAAEAHNRAAEQAAGERIRRLNRVYAVLSHINHTIVRERNLSALFDRTCRIAVDQGGFAAAWIALTPDSPAGSLQIAADAGPAGHAGALRAARRRPGIRHQRPGPGDRREPTGHRQRRRGGGATADGMRAARGARRRARLPGRRLLPAAIRRCRARRARPERVRRGLVRRRRSELLDELAMDVGFAMDVSRGEAERDQAAAALRESQVRLERAVRAGNVGLWEWSLVSSTVYYSSQWKRQLGYEDDEIGPTSRPGAAGSIPTTSTAPSPASASYLRGQAPHLEIEYRCRHKDGTLSPHAGPRDGAARRAVARRWRCSAPTSTSPITPSCRRSSSRRRRWRASAGSPAASPTTSTTC